MREKNFEQSFARLEEILDRMNSGKLTLDESLKLYEEADQLIALCSSHLNGVEKRIETLVKNRDGELRVDHEKKPLTEIFQNQEPFQQPQSQQLQGQQPQATGLET